MVGNEHKPRGCNLKLKTDQSILALGNEGLSARHFALRFSQFPFGLQRLMRVTVAMSSSSARGLILKQEEDFGEAGAKDRTHMSIRYEYGNIQAPRM